MTRFEHIVERGPHLRAMPQIDERFVRPDGCHAPQVVVHEVGVLRLRLRAPCPAEPLTTQLIQRAR